jgi:hypothetical protein
MSKVLSRYQTHGFIPFGAPPARRTKKAAAVSIAKGDFLFDDGSGYVTNVGTVFALTGLGVAAADCDNSAGAAGALSVEIYPIDELTQYSVPVGNNAVITIDAVGTYVDLYTHDDIDISDTVGGGIAFFIDDFDASTEAKVGNAYGYAIGHFATFGAVAA